MYFSLQKGQTALMKASIEGYANCANLLLDKRATVDLEDEVSQCHNQSLSLF